MMQHCKLRPAHNGLQKRRGGLANIVCFLDEVIRRLDEDMAVGVYYFHFTELFDWVGPQPLRSLLIDRSLIKWVEKFSSGRAFLRPPQSESREDTSKILPGSAIRTTTDFTVCALLS